MAALEDTAADIIGKAIRGLGASISSVASKAGLSEAAIQRLCDGTFDSDAASRVAPVLGLNAGALVAIGTEAWAPEPVTVEGVEKFVTPFHDITVNSYLAWDHKTRKAVAFDTGADCGEMLDAIRSMALTLELILITHTHGDHIYDLDRLKEKTGAEAYVSDRESLEGAHAFSAGKTFEVGKLRIETRQTWGHSRGGITYVVHGLSRVLAVAGDAIFAGSMGGGNVSYRDALRTDKEEILTLPDETVICPGHGPLTTVREEKRHNPFFA